MEVAKGFHECGFSIMATGRTCDMIEAAGIPALKVWKINEGRPNILDKITNGKIQLIVNTPIGKKGAVDDSYIRKGAIKGHIPYMTTMAAAKATAAGILEVKQHPNKELRSLQNIQAAIER